MNAMKDINKINQLTVSVKLAALIIESVCDLMTNDGADAAKVKVVGDVAVKEHALKK